MPAIRLTGRRGMTCEEIAPGDTMLQGEIAQFNNTVGAATLPASQLISGILNRAGSTAVYTDTTDTAANILSVLAGNGPAGAIVVGSSFRLRIINTVNFAETITLGAGLITGSGSVSTVAAFGFRDFLFTFLSLQQPLGINTTMVTGTNILTWVLPTGQLSLAEGVAFNSVNIQPGASVTGTNIPAGTTVTGIIQGQGGTIGVTLSANVTATNNVGVLAQFGPSIKVDGIGGGTS